MIHHVFGGIPNVVLFREEEIQEFGYGEKWFLHVALGVFEEVADEWGNFAFVVAEFVVLFGGEEVGELLEGDGYAAFAVDCVFVEGVLDSLKKTGSNSRFTKKIEIAYINISEI